MNGLLRLLACGVVPVLVASGCGDSRATPTPVFPPRPVSIPIDRISPCAAFDAAQKQSLRLRKETPTRPTVENLPSVGCVWLTDSDLAYAIQTIPIPAVAATSDPTTAIVEVNGFGAVRGASDERSGGAPNCQITVDAAPEGSIRLQVRGAVRADRTEDELCRLATEAASMVMTTVVGTGT